MCEQRTPTDRDLPWDRAITRRDILKYGGTLGFTAVGASMLAACTPISQLAGAPAAHHLEVPPATAKYLVVVILDAGRADYLSYGHFPHIQSLIDRGAHYPNAWCGQMQAITPASHASLGTGMFPRHDGGVLGFWWENPNTLTPYTCAPLTNSTDPTQPGSHFAIDPGIIETIIRDSNSPTLAGLMKDFDPTAKIYAGSGNKFYAADAVGGPDADYITYFWNNGPHEYRPVSIGKHDVPAGILNDPAFHTLDYGHMIGEHPGQQDSLVVDLAIKVIERERPRVVLLNLPELDWPVAHVYGGPLDRNMVVQHMENADRALGRLFDAYRNLGIFDQTVFCVMGDHGVLPLQERVDKTDAETAVRQAGTIIGDDDYHTAGFIWMEDTSKAMKTTSLIDQAKIPGVKAVYFLGDVAGRAQYLPSIETASSITPQLDRAYRYLLETMNGPTAPHVVLLYPERTGTLDVGGTNPPWRGDHGGPTWASQNLALVMAGPGIRLGFRSQFPARLVDLTPTFLRLLGAPYPQLDGTALADAFVTPTRGERAAQQGLATTLSPMARELSRQSTLDIRQLPGHLPHKLKKLKNISGGAIY